MLKSAVAIMLRHGKRRSQTTCCCSHIARAASNQHSENTSCLDSTSANCVSNAGYNAANYQIVHPGKVSPERFVPSHIERPSYALDNTLSRILHHSWLHSRFGIEIKSEEQIRGMRDACRYDYCCKSEFFAHFILCLGFYK